jgi:hypothetical protein
MQIYIKLLINTIVTMAAATITAAEPVATAKHSIAVIGSAAC